MEKSICSLSGAQREVKSCSSQAEHHWVLLFPALSTFQGQIVLSLDQVVIGTKTVQLNNYSWVWLVCDKPVGKTNHAAELLVSFCISEIQPGKIDSSW